MTCGVVVLHRIDWTDEYERIRSLTIYYYYYYYYYIFVTAICWGMVSTRIGKLGDGCRRDDDLALLLYYGDPHGRIHIVYIIC